MADKKVTKEKQISIDVIPKGWKALEMSSICDISSSRRIFLKEYAKVGIPFYRSKEIIMKSNKQNINNPLFISSEKYENIKMKFGVPKSGDILLTSVGTLGIPYIINDNEKFYFKDGNLTWFKDFNNEIYNLFIYYWFRSNIAQETISAIAIGTTQRALTINSLKKIKVLLPPLQEQKFIGLFLKSLDDKIELNNQINQTLEQIAQSIFKHWFIDFEFPNGQGLPYKSSGGEMVESELGEIPKGWKVTNIGRELVTVLGGTPDTKNKSFWESGKIAWINSGEVNNFRIISPTAYITELAMKNSATKLMPKGTTVIAITGATLGKVSRIEIDCCANQSVVGILESQILSSEYIYFWIKNKIGEFISFQTGGAQQHINKDNINNCKILIPEIEKIKEFNKIVKLIFEKINLNCFQSQTLSQIRDTLLPKLMTGKIRVNPDE